MENNTFSSPEQNTAPIPQQETPAGEPYTVNDIPVTEPQPQTQYEQPAPQPQYQQAPDYQQPAPQLQYQQTYQQPYTPAPSNPGKSNATAAMILGLVSIFFSPTVIIGLGCGIAAIVLGLKSKKASLEAGFEVMTEQKVGFISGIIGTVIAGFAVLGIIISIILPIFFALLALPFAAMGG